MCPFSRFPYRPTHTHTFVQMTKIKELTEVEQDGQSCDDGTYARSQSRIAEVVSWASRITGGKGNTTQAKVLRAAAHRQSDKVESVRVTSTTKCPGSCGVLELKPTSAAGFFCDRCAKTFPRATEMYGCSRCCFKVLHCGFIFKIVMTKVL